MIRKGRASETKFSSTNPFVQPLKSETLTASADSILLSTFHVLDTVPTLLHLRLVLLGLTMKTVEGSGCLFYVGA